MPVNIDIKVSGIEQARRILQEVPNAVKVALKDSAITLRGLARGRSPVGIRRGSGEFKNAWGAVEPTARGFSFSNPEEYGQVLEQGLYPSVGPRTISVHGGIYSRQAPGGILSPLIEDDQVINSVLSLIVQQILKGLG
jgi:hypothetical protein